jgi:hypothetical protein
MKWFYSFGADDGKTSSAWPALIPRTVLILEYANGLAWAEAHCKIDLRAQRLRRPLLDHVAAIIVAELEDSGRHLDAAAIPLT